jgi:GST-like protein
MAQQPIQLYYWPTPNGIKVTMLVEELGWPYEVVPVNITRGDQFEAEFLRISPNNKMPAIVDPDGPNGEALSLFESGAILLYLADKADQFLPREPVAYYRTIQWLMFQMGGLGPMAGQAHHFRNYAPEHIQYAFDRYTNETHRLYAVLERRLSEAAYLGGDAYTIADMASWPWIRPHENQGQDLAAFPHLQRWFETIGERPAVQRAVAVQTEVADSGKSNGGFDERAREVLFGHEQYRSH